MKRVPLNPKRRKTVFFATRINPDLDNRVRNDINKTGEKVWEWVEDAFEKKLSERK